MLQVYAIEYNAVASEPIHFVITIHSPTNNARPASTRHTIG